MGTAVMITYTGQPLPIWCAQVYPRRSVPQSVVPPNQLKPSGPAQDRWTDRGFSSVKPDMGDCPTLLRPAPAGVSHTSATGSIMPTGPDPQLSNVPALPWWYPGDQPRSIYTLVTNVRPVTGGGWPVLSVSLLSP